MNGLKCPSQGTPAARAKPSQTQIRDEPIDLVRKDIKGPAVGDEELELWGHNTYPCRIDYFVSRSPQDEKD